MAVKSNEERHFYIKITQNRTETKPTNEWREREREWKKQQTTTTTATAAIITTTTERSKKNEKKAMKKTSISCACDGYGKRYEVRVFVAKAQWKFFWKPKYVCLLNFCLLSVAYHITCGIKKMHTHTTSTHIAQWVREAYRDATAEPLCTNDILECENVLCRCALKFSVQLVIV